MMPEAHARADGDPAHARAPLPRHAGHRVHRRGGAPLHAPDAQREAAGAGRGAVRGRCRRGGAARRARRRSRRSTPAALDALLHPTFDPDAEFDVLARGVAASPGAAKGEIVFTADEAVAAGEEGRDVDARAAVHRGRRRGRLLRRQGHPHERGRQGQPRRARGARDGPALRVPARRARDRPVGAGGARERHGRCTSGDRIAIDGTTGAVTTDDVPLVEPEVDDDFETVLDWADELRAARRAHERRHAGGRAQGARVRRRGDRPLPHRAHVHGGGAPGRRCAR